MILYIWRDLRQNIGKSL